MPSFGTYKKMLSSTGMTVGQAFKMQSDMVMEQTWNNDLESKECYIYDYFHDDQPYLNQGMTYEGTSKTKISLKFIQTQSGSISKDEVDFLIQFKPSQKMFFSPGDELYYYETDYRQKYYAQFPIGMFVDIYDDNDKLYHKWLIVDKEEGLQFVKYNVLKCNYYFHWIEHIDGKRIKRKMWGVRRAQNSYNSGIWSGKTFTTPQNQSITWLPMNVITKELYYNYNDTLKNMRIVMSSPGVERPVVWQISKIESAQPLGLNKMTLYQTEWNENVDFIDEEEIAAGDLFAYYADYYAHEGKTVPEEIEPNKIEAIAVDIQSYDSSIKVGGSYRTLEAIIRSENNDVTEQYSNAKFVWTAAIDGDVIPTDNIIWSDGETSNIKKVKLAKVRKYIGKTLTITCTMNGRYVGTTQLNISAV